MTSSLQHEAREEILLIFRAKNKLKIIPSDHKEVIRALVRFKEGLETVEGYDHIPVPPVYSQVTLTTALLPHSKRFLLNRSCTSPHTPTSSSLSLDTNTWTLNDE